MVVLTVGAPQGQPETNMQPAYLDYLLQAASDFGNEIGVDPGQTSTMVALLLSPVDDLE
jgi:hypothetical protein